MAVNNTISYQSVADDLGVSLASVRNWVKCGYLELVSAGHVHIDSFDAFKRDIAGKDKLVSRANKTLFDDHNHQRLKATVAGAILAGVNADQLSDLYENGLSNSFKNKEGIYYTPKDICDDFFAAIPFPVAGSIFCDPCCGTGNFILSAIDAGFEPQNIWGYDTDPIAVNIAKARLFAKTGQHANLHVGDFFAPSFHKHDVPFDVVMTNPPWGKKLSKDRKSALGDMLEAGKSTDTSSLFMLAAIQSVRDGGVVGMLVPEAFLNVMSFKDAREKILSHRLLQASCYGKPFTGVMAKAKSLIVQKNHGVSAAVLCKNPDGVFERRQTTFLKNPNYIINETVGVDEDKALSRVFDTPHVTLKNKAKWALGIVTGNNKRFVSTRMKDGYIPVFTGKDLSPHKIAAPSFFIPNDFSLYQQVAPQEMYQARSKLIYKFISSRLVFFHDTDGRYVLNSANIMIPSQSLAVSNQVLSEYFSSDFVNWIFQRIFGAHKVLRSDLETIPIFADFLSSHDGFNEQKLIDNLGLEKEKNGAFRVKE